MEMKFEEQRIEGLSSIVHRKLTQEQTHQVHIGEQMPEIASVLGAWGKAIIRSKEWRDNAMQISGGIMVWVCYLSEGEGTPQCVEDWIPFQMKWEIPKTDRDGYLFVEPSVKSVDARALSSRKLMIRANICCDGNGLIKNPYSVYSPGQIPKDLNLLTAEYPLTVPREAGERMVQIQEDIGKPLGKILRYDLKLYMTEQRIMASRLIFRGKGKIHIVHLVGDKVSSFDQEMDFAQFADLNEDYGTGAISLVQPILTNLELTQTDGKWTLKGEMAAQYIIFDRIVVKIAEDGYSNLRDVELFVEPLQIPCILDLRTHTEVIDVTLDVSSGDVVDLCNQVDCSQINGQPLLVCQTKGLYYDDHGVLRMINATEEKQLHLDARENVEMACLCGGEEGISVLHNSASAQLTLNENIQICATSAQKMSMVVGFKMGDINNAEKQGPSIVLTRYQADRLWDLAKACGSTVEAICQANAIEGEPEQGRMLLIPIG